MPDLITLELQGYRVAKEGSSWAVFRYRWGHESLLGLYSTKAEAISVATKLCQQET